MYYFVKIIRIVCEGCTNASDHFPKISGDFRGGSEDVSIADQHLSARLAFNKGKNSSLCEDIDIFTLHSGYKIDIFTSPWVEI